MVFYDSQCGSCCAHIPLGKSVWRGVGINETRFFVSQPSDDHFNTANFPGFPEANLKLSKLPLHLFITIYSSSPSPVLDPNHEMVMAHLHKFKLNLGYVASLSPVL